MGSYVRTSACTAADARKRLRTAHAYLVAAELVLTDEQEEYAGVAAGNAVLAAIAAADAICCRNLKKRFRGADHRQAAELLEIATSEGAKNKATLLRLLDLKDEAHYGFGDFSRGKARTAVRLARELITNADSTVNR